MDEHYFKLTMVLIAVVFVITVFFCWTLFDILGRIPVENQKFPRWFVWLILIPYIGFVFQWLMLPFGIPTALRKTFPANQEAINAAEMLFKVGLALVIFTSFGLFFHISPINQITTGLWVISWIAYWILIVKFKNKYLIAVQRG